MQVGVKENVLRFFWPSNQGVKQYQYTRLVFGAKCSSTIAIVALNQTAVDFCNKEPNTQQLIRNSYYMDGFVHPYDNLLEAQKPTKAVKVALQKEGFNLTKILSSITEVLDFLREPKTENKGTIHRVLAVKWDTRNDTLVIQPVLKNNITAKEMSLPKILSNVARMFDPLGLIAPFAVTLKILLQQLWQFGISWGQEISQEYIPILGKWTQKTIL